MKLGGRDAARFLARPDPGRAGVLLHGADPMRVALKRQDLVRTLIGPAGADEFRLERIAAQDLRRDPALLGDAMRARGFFGGTRVVLVEDATDTAAPACAAALGGWQAGDGIVIVTGQGLGPRSALRKLFEDHAAAVAIGIYDDPPTADEIAATLAAAGLKSVAPRALADLEGLARALDPGDFRQTVEKLSLYALDAAGPVTEADVAACAPLSVAAELDDAVESVADARPEELARLLARLAAQGIGPVPLCGGVTRHFRQLHAAASDPGGPEAGVARLRPPPFGPRRDRMVRQAAAWGRARLEEVLSMLLETEFQLRSSSRVPAHAAVERTLIRIARLPRRQEAT
jgi:DNA polymerase-3 subunit delta